MITRRSKISQDTAIGVLFAGTFALGVALLSTVKNYTRDLFGLLLVQGPRLLRNREALAFWYGDRRHD